MFSNFAPSQASDLKVKDLRARVSTTRANLTSELEPEAISSNFAKRAKVSDSDGVDFAIPRRNNFASRKGTKDDLLDANDSNVADRSDSPLPSNRESAPTNSLVNNDDTLPGPKSTSALSNLSKSLVSPKLFSGIAATLVITVVSSLVFQVAIMGKANRLEDEISENMIYTRRLENLLLSLNKAFEEDLAVNVNRTNTLEDIVIPAIETDLEENINKTDTIQTVTIPDIQDDLLANINKTATLETSVNSRPKMYYGTAPVNTWLASGGATVYQNIDISMHNFVLPPIVITSLAGGTQHWSTIGASSVHDLTKDSFRVYIRWSGGSALTPSDAESKAWQIQYVLFSRDP